MLSPADRLDITDLVNRYAARLDSRDVVATAALFAEDGVLIVPRPPQSLGPVEAFEGREAIAPALARVLRLDGTAHEVVGLVIDADPESDERAFGRPVTVAHHFRRGGDIVWHPHYEDVYVHTAEGWRIARRELTIDSIRVVDVQHPRPADDS